MSFAGSWRRLSGPLSRSRAPGVVLGFVFACLVGSAGAHAASSPDTAPALTDLWPAFDAGRHAELMDGFTRHVADRDAAMHRLARELEPRRAQLSADGALITCFVWWITVDFLDAHDAWLAEGGVSFFTDVELEALRKVPGWLADGTLKLGAGHGGTLFVGSYHAPIDTVLLSQDIVEWVLHGAPDPPEYWSESDDLVADLLHELWHALQDALIARLPLMEEEAHARLLDLWARTVLRSDGSPATAAEHPLALDLGDWELPEFAPVEGVPDDLVQLADELMLAAQADFETEAWKRAGELLAGQTTRSEAVASVTPQYANMRAVMTLQMAVSSWAAGVPGLDTRAEVAATIEEFEAHGLDPLAFIPADEPGLELHLLTHDVGGNPGGAYALVIGCQILYGGWVLEGARRERFYKGMLRQGIPEIAAGLCKFVSTHDGVSAPGSGGSHRTPAATQ